MPQTSKSGVETFKKIVKKVPYSREVYRHLTQQNVPKEDYLEPLPKGAEPADRDRARLLNLLSYTKSSGSEYSAQQFPAGYHEIEINGEVYAGQRRPQQRLSQVPIDFTGLSVLDIGCNQGGMLHALGDAPKWKVGVDFNPNMINVCNQIARQRGDHKSDFYVFDIDNDAHDLIESFLREEKVDVVFLLAVCMWVKRWKEIIDLTARVGTQLVFESNGTKQQQDEQEEYLRVRFGSVERLADASDDDPGTKKRRLYLAQSPIPA